MEPQKIRVRFAPSPTGPLHIGGVRTALFNYLFAKQKGGEFYLRIEDTDLERSKPEYETEIIDSLKWLGLEWDGIIVKQSSRIRNYQKWADQLVREGFAYPAEGAIKFKIPKRTVSFEDSVYGKVSFDSSAIEDFVIQKSNGFPTYHFACVVDDHEFAVTHVIRGGDHLSNTPKQILLSEALNWTPPQFAHLPLVLGKSGQPLSKRDNEVNLSYYKDEGYVPEGILNYIALLGWSAGGNREHYTKKELIETFSLKKVNKTNAIFDIEKLKWLNGEHLKALSDDEFVACADVYLKLRVPDFENLVPNSRGMILLFKPRVRILNDFLNLASFFWASEPAYDAAAVKEHLQSSLVMPVLKDLRRALEQLSDFEDEVRIETSLRGCAEGAGREARDLIHAVRVALTGRSVSPSLFSVMRVLGKTLVLKRIDAVLNRLSVEASK